MQRYNSRADIRRIGWAVRYQVYRKVKRVSIPAWSVLGNWPQWRVVIQPNSLFIYYHKRTDCFVVSQLISVTRQTRCVALGSKPGWLYVSLICYPKAITFSTWAKKFLTYVFAIDSYLQNLYFACHIWRNDALTDIIMVFMFNTISSLNNSVYSIF